MGRCWQEPEQHWQQICQSPCVFARINLSAYVFLCHQCTPGVFLWIKMELSSKFCVIGNALQLHFRFAKRNKDFWSLKLVEYSQLALSLLCSCVLQLQIRIQDPPKIRQGTFRCQWLQLPPNHDPPGPAERLPFGLVTECGSLSCEVPKCQRFWS